MTELEPLKNEQAYLNLLKTIKEHGTVRGDRTGTGTISIFGHQMRFNLQDGFPLLTSKKVFSKGVFVELLWFLKGLTNIRYLLENNVHIWSEWAFKRYTESAEYTGSDMTDFGRRKEKDPEFKVIYKEQMHLFEQRVLDDQEFGDKWGELGDVYGSQWRRWKKRDGGIIDQIQDVIDEIKANPNSRRLMVSAWNPEDVPSMALPPCHAVFQFYVQNNKLSCQLNQRSGDTFLGVPFNIASYALLTHLIAHECDLEVGEFIHTLGDAHIYSNHVDQVDLQLSREDHLYDFPTLELNPYKKSIFDFEYEDIKVVNYKSHPAIKAPVAV